MLVLLVALVCGTLFGLGLVISQMVNPAKVLNFLDVTGQWDPTLGVVFICALSVGLPFYQWVLRTRRQAVLDEEFDVPDNSSITPSLIGGSALFGAGWGLAGLCPGPGITALPTLLPGVLGFTIAMIVGMMIYRFANADKRVDAPPRRQGISNS